MHITFIHKNRSSFFSLLLLVILSFFITTNTAKAYPMYSSSPVKINWSSQNVKPGSCTKSENYNGSIWTGGISEVGNQTFLGSTFISPPQGTYTFTFRCISSVDDLPRTAVDTLYVTSPKVKLAFTKLGDPFPFSVAPLTFTLSAADYYVETKSSTVISWNYSDLNGTCTGGGRWSGIRPLSGSMRVYAGAVEANRTYSLTCSSPNYPIQENRTITIYFEGYGNGN